MNIYEITQLPALQITPLLGVHRDYPVVYAILEGNSPGRILVDNPVEPQSAFVLTNAGFSFLAGSPQNEDFNQALKTFLDHELFPSLQTTDDPTMVLYPLEVGWETQLQSMLEGYQTLNLYRTQFTFHEGQFAQHADQHTVIPQGFSLHAISPNLLEKFKADMFPWESPQAFLEKGFGFWLLANDEIACECSSVFVGGRAAEINIHTDEKYQRQGLAAITATAFIRECLARGLRPNWECWWENQPSIALARKLGFVPVRDHPVILAELV